MRIKLRMSVRRHGLRANESAKVSAERGMCGVRRLRRPVRTNAAENTDGLHEKIRGRYAAEKANVGRDRTFRCAGIDVLQ